MLLFGLGTGCCFMPLNTIILSAVAREDSGAASGVSQTIMWLGGAIGTAVLVTIFGIAMRNASGPPAAVLTHGITGAFTGVAIFAVCALAIVLALIRQRAPRRV
jgi:MFS family permease